MQPLRSQFDIEEGERGIAESGFRLDEVIAQPGDRLYYEYDFGDSWNHTIRLKKAEAWPDGDPVARCLAGRRACPPEDVGGMYTYHEVVEVLAGRIDPESADWTGDLLGWNARMCTDSAEPPVVLHPEREYALWRRRWTSQRAPARPAHRRATPSDSP